MKWAKGTEGLYRGEGQRQEERVGGANMTGSGCVRLVRLRLITDSRMGSYQGVPKGCHGWSPGPLAQPKLLRAKKLFLAIAVCDIPEHPQHVASVHKSLRLVFSNVLSSQSKHCFGFISALSLFMALGISLTAI